MSRISIQITKKALVIRKGRGQLTIPVEGADGPVPDKLLKIHYVSEEVAEEIRPGITKIRYREKAGTVTGKPVYRKYLNYGFWYAVVKWEDGVVEMFNLNKMGIEIEI